MLRHCCTRYPAGVDRFGNGPLSLRRYFHSPLAVPWLVAVVLLRGLSQGLVQIPPAGEPPGVQTGGRQACGQTTGPTPHRPNHCHPGPFDVQRRQPRPPHDAACWTRPSTVENGPYSFSKSATAAISWASRTTWRNTFHRFQRSHHVAGCPTAAAGIRCCWPWPATRSPCPATRRLATPGSTNRSSPTPCAASTTKSPVVAARYLRP